MRYRKEIDGLRALAILPVILFHAGVSGFSGGYIGVDVFFVISGYLITSIIVEEKRQGKFSIISFYERRARRILPALSFLLISTTIAAYITLPAHSLKGYSQSLVSVSTFSSNLYFYLTGGYFALAAHETPLLHTWSLAVEEQYYLFFPVMIVVLWSLGQKWVIFCVALLATLSLLSAQFLSSRSVDANFYLIFSRAWELLLGSLLAFKRFDVSRWKREVIGILSVALIAYSIASFTSHTPFPSLYTLVPVLGTCFIIAFVDSASFTGRVLSNPLLVGIGLLSYSLYLWHQPVFSFLRLVSIGKPSSSIFLVAALSVFVLAAFSWACVERPFRNKSRFSRKTPEVNDIGCSQLIEKKLSTT